MTQFALRFDGSDYLPWRDDERLTGQFWRVFRVMADEDWHTLSEIARRTGDHEASVSAQLRHMRKERFGAHTLEKEYQGDGLFTYRLIVNRQWDGAVAASSPSPQAAPLGVEQGRSENGGPIEEAAS